MSPTVAFHRIAALELGPIFHFDRREGGRLDFWTRRLTMTDAAGDRFDVNLFSDGPDGLMTEAEKKEAADRLAAVEAAQAEAERAAELAVA